MTGYDPFAYGQVRLGNGQQKAEGNPDDILFADGGPSRPAAPAASAEQDWELLDADVGSLLPGKGGAAPAMDFAADVLGEGAPPAGVSAPTAPRQRSAANARPRPVAAAAPAAPAKQKEKLAPARRPSPMDLRGGYSASAVMVPLLTVVVGGTGAAWLAVMQQNPVLAGIVGTAAVLAAGFLRVFLKR